MIENDDEQAQQSHQNLQANEDSTAKINRQRWFDKEKAADPQEGKYSTPNYRSKTYGTRHATRLLSRS